AVDSHRRLCRVGGGDSHRLSPGTASALLGAQDAQHPGKSTEIRLRRDQSRSPGHLSGRKPSSCRNRVPQIPRPLATLLSQHGETAWTRLTRAAVVLCFPSPLVAQTTYHQRDRTMFRGSTTKDSAHGLFCECRERGSHHLLHLPEIQP